MITVRNVTRDDIASLVALCAENLPEKWSDSSFLSELDKGSVILCASDGDEIIAFAVATVSFDEAYLDLIAVNADYRRRGGARRLLSDIEDALRIRGVTRIVLDVRCSNTAVKLYEACGFRTLCTRRDFYANPREDGFTMQKELGC